MPRPPSRWEDHHDIHEMCLIRINDAETAIQDIRSLINHANREKDLKPAELNLNAIDVQKEKPKLICKELSSIDQEDTTKAMGTQCTFTRYLNQLLDGPDRQASRRAQDVLITDEVVFKALTTDHHFSSANKIVEPRKPAPEVDRSEFKLLAVGRNAQERLGHFWTWPPLVNPESWTATIFLVLGLACILYEVVLVPHQFAFDYETEHWMLICFSISDAYFLIDIPFTFLLMHEDGNGNLVMDWRLIARSYLSTWFALDCAAAIPSQLLDFGGGALLLRLRKLFRLIRTIPRLLKVHRRLESHFLQVEALLTIFRGMQFALAFGMTIHWLSCGWYFVGSLTDTRNSETWLTYYADVYGFDTASIRYCWSAYFIVTTMTTIGYGDITPRSIQEVSFALLLLPIAAIYFSVVMGIIMEFIASLTTVNRRTRQMRRRLAMFLQWRNVPKNLRHRVKQYMNFVWNKSQDNLTYEEEIKTILPLVLHEDLCYSLYKEVLEAAPFFIFMRHYTLCMRHLASLVRMKNFEVGDIIFRVGDTNRTLYILLTGSIWLSLNQVLSTQNNLEDKVSALHFSIASLSKKNVERVPGSQRYSTWHSSYLTAANFKLELYDIMQRRVVRKVQRRWRERKAARNTERQALTSRPSEKKTLSGLSSHMVSAPAYIGESCLWSNCQMWDVEPPHVYSYTATCTTRAELMVIDRSMLRATMDRFSPWLEQRFELFQSFVSDSFAARVAFEQWPHSPKYSREDP